MDPGTAVALSGIGSALLMGAASVAVALINNRRKTEKAAAVAAEETASLAADDKQAALEEQMKITERTNHTLRESNAALRLRLVDLETEIARKDYQLRECGENHGR